MLRTKKQTLIKSKDRVRDAGEVFTPDFLVEQMLDQFPAEAWEKTKNWLEPTCGNGQFIIGILKRKMSHGHKILEALDTVFGCDIMKDNVSECHMRIYDEIVMPYFKSKKSKNWKGLRWKVACIVENNIRFTKDSLLEDFSKWRRFTSTSETYKTNMEAKIKSIIKIIDEGKNESALKTAHDKRLFRELSRLDKK
jgi:hypothetical protein